MAARRSSAGATGVVAAMILSTTSAAAQEAPGHAAAVARFQEGTRLVEQGNCKAAIPKFTESLKSEEGVGAHLNLADCYAREGSPERAWMEFKAAERFATLKRNDERREVAHNGAYALERKLLRLTLTITYVEGVEMRINGVPVERELLETRLVAVAPGKFTIEVTAPRKRRFTTEGAGAAGEVKAVTIALEDDPAAMPKAPLSPTPGDAPQSATQRTVGLVVGAVGIASLAAGGAFGLIAISDKDKLKDAFATNPSCTGTYPSGTCSGGAHAELDGLENSAHTAATVSTVLVIIGGVALATGVTLVFTAPSSRRSTAAAAARALFMGGVW